jgi:uncharacterized protein DUF1876
MITSGQLIREYEKRFLDEYKVYEESWKQVFDMGYKVFEINAATQANPRSLRVTVLQDKNATVAEALYGRFRATGSAKRNKDEKHNPEVGRTLATARALKALAREMEKSVDV